MYLEEDIWPNTSTNIVLWNSMVNICPVGMVDDFPWCWVLNIVSNIIVHHDNDVVIRDTVGMNDLVGVADIGLVTIVIPSIATSNKENPQ